MLRVRLRVVLRSEAVDAPRRGFRRFPVILPAVGTAHTPAHPGVLGLADVVELLTARPLADPRLAVRAERGIQERVQAEYEAVEPVRTPLACASHERALLIFQLHERPSRVTDHITLIQRADRLGAGPFRLRRPDRLYPRLAAVRQSARRVELLEHLMKRGGQPCAAVVPLDHDPGAVLDGLEDDAAGERGRGHLRAERLHDVQVMIIGGAFPGDRVRLLVAVLVAVGRVDADHRAVQVPDPAFGADRGNLDGLEQVAGPQCVRHVIKELPLKLLPLEPGALGGADNGLVEGF